MITYLILGFVVVMLIGNFMSAKPKDGEMAIESIRLMARKIQLMPSLSSTPDWLKEHISANMVAIYTLINDDWRLPMACYINNDGKWQFAINPANSSERKSDVEFIKKAERLIGNISLPHELVPFVKGLIIKANSIAVIFDDGAFVKAMMGQAKSKSLDDHSQSAKHLNTLKQTLLIWGDRVND